MLCADLLCHSLQRALILICRVIACTLTCVSICTCILCMLTSLKSVPLASLRHNQPKPCSLIFPYLIPLFFQSARELEIMNSKGGNGNKGEVAVTKVDSEEQTLTVLSKTLVDMDVEVELVMSALRYLDDNYSTPSSPFSASTSSSSRFSSSTSTSSALSSPSAAPSDRILTSTSRG